MKGFLKVIISLIIISMIGVFCFSGCKSAVEEAAAGEEVEEAAAGEEVEEAAGEEEQVVANEKIRITNICHQPHIEFFGVAKVGIKDFVDNIWGWDNVDVTWTGPLPGEWSVEKQIEIIEASIPNSDAIICTAPDPTAFNEVIQKAKDAGLPVILYNADAPDSGRDAFVGQDRYETGVSVGKEVIKYADENLADRGEGEIKYAISIAFAGHSALENINRGYRDVLDKDPRFVSVLPDYIVSGTDPLGVYDNCQNAVLSYPDLDFILHCDACGGYSGQVINDNNLQDQIAVFTVCSSTLDLDMLKAGAMKFVADQNQYLQGYIPMSLLYLYFELGMPVIDAGMNLDTGYIPITQDNIDENYAMYESIMERFAQVDF